MPAGLRRVLPWGVSLAALLWVFGRESDWPAVWSALQTANLEVFATVVILDKLVFFLAWSWFQAESIRRTAGTIRTREVIALRGGSELLRAANQALGDAAFVLGLVRVAPGGITAVAAATLVPFACHFLVLLAQATLSLPLLSGGLEQNRDVQAAVIVGWSTLAVGVLLARLGPRLGLGLAHRLREWVARIDFAGLRRILFGFVVLGMVDVAVNRWLAASFGVDLPWSAVMARLPILYAILTLPSLGNFGTREAAWAFLYGDLADAAALRACALATNTAFLLLNVLIGAAFLPRALDLLAEVRRARAEGVPVEGALLHDAGDP